MSNLLSIPVDAIHQSKHQLRDVNVESPAFLEMVDSIRSMGLINPISVRRERNEETNEEQYVLVDGAHRFAACRAAGLKEIDAKVLDVNELDSLFAQIVGNASRVETKLYSYSKQLQRAIAIDSNLTASRIATSIGKPESYVRKLLNLDTLSPAIGSLLDNGTLGLMEAIAISKLPAEHQMEWTEKAASAESAVEFVNSAAGFAKQLKRAKTDGVDVSEVPFEAPAKQRKITEIRAVIDQESNELLGQITKGATKPSEAGRLALLWAIQLDADTVAERQAKHDQLVAEKKAANQQSKAEAKRRMLEKRQAEVAKLKAEIGE